jgi:NAD(P)-dependent dehydrogenase (short-subunit alcohol dehydrogenase family)
MRLKGKVAIITGAAGGIPGEVMGFGGATAWLFAREGAKVVLTDVADERGEASVAAIRGEGLEATYHHLDVTSSDEWQAVIAATVDAYGALNVLVNNAGTGTIATVEETSEQEWDGILDVHAKGVFLGCKHAIPALRASGGGSIVNVSSMYGIVGSMTSASYHAAKGAIRTFTKAVAIQYAADRIRANSVHPGIAVTPLTKPQLDEGGEAAAAASLENIPLGRLGAADDIAPGILYLASDESSYVTGAELVIDGGFIAR